ncbi:MAG: DUF4249 domain-containing protein [Saprospiraceae bacterium]
MKKYIFVIALLATVFMSSCGFSFETTLEVDPPPHDPEIVVHTFIKPNDTIINAGITRSYGLLDNTGDFDERFLNDATVEIFQQGELKYTLESKVDNYDFQFTGINYCLSFNEPVGGLGDSFEIKVSHPDYPSVRAVQYMPKEAVPLTSAKFDEDGGIGDEGERLNSIDLTFTDPADEENYYEIYIAYRDESTPGEVNFFDIRVETNDPNIQRGNTFNSFLLDDLAINGSEYTLNLQLDNDYADNMYVIFRSVSRDWYLYSRSARDFREGSDFGTFAEPVTVHRNIDGGLGVFAAGVEHLMKVEEE